MSSHLPCSLVTIALVSTACSAVRVQNANAERPVDARKNELTIQVGQQELDAATWAPVDTPLAAGIEFSTRSPTSMFGWEGGVAFASQSEGLPDLDVGGMTFTNVDATTTLIDVWAGGRATFFKESSLRPYVGAGALLVMARFELDTDQGFASADDTTFGGYGHAGIEFQLGSGFLVGVDYRRSIGIDVEFEGVTGDGDHEQIAFFLGFCN